jgi:hypothetical protein
METTHESMHWVKWSLVQQWIKEIGTYKFYFNHIFAMRRNVAMVRTCGLWWDKRWISLCRIV